MKISISQYLDQSEQDYVNFSVTAEGLRDALEYLNVKMAKRHRRRLSPWQFTDPEDSRECYAAMVAGDVAKVIQILVKFEQMYS